MRWTDVLHNSAKFNLANFKKTGLVPRPQRLPVKTVGSQKITGVFRGSTINDVVKILRHQYDGMLTDENGTLLNLSKLTSRQLMTDNRLSMNIFKNLLKLRSIDKRPISRKILFTLLGIKPQALNDKTKVTKHIDSLLNQDKDIERAMYVLKLSTFKNPVAMNRVIEYSLKLGKIDDGLKVFNDCKKWKYKPNDQTFVILFDGISKNLPFKQYTETEAKIFKNLLEKYESLETPTISIFNALLSCLVRNLNDDQLMSWEIFDKLETLKPDNITFTIFVRGLCKNRDYKIKKIQNSTILRKDKLIQTIKLNTSLIENVELVSKKLEKVDNLFVTNYLKAFNNYHYNTMGLQQLYNWSNDFKLMSDELKLNFKASKKIRESKEKELGELNKNLKHPLKYHEITNTPQFNVELNIYMIQIILELLAQLDRPVQFINVCWYLLKHYGGVNFSKLPTLKEPEVTDIKYEPPTESVVDMKLIESMMFYIHQIFMKEQKSSAINLQILKYVKPSYLKPTTHSYLNVVQMVSEEMHYFIRFNYNQLKDMQKKDKNFRILKDPLTAPQIEYLINNLKLLLELAEPLPVDEKADKKKVKKLNKKKHEELQKKQEELAVTSDMVKKSTIDQVIINNVKKVTDRISHCNWTNVDNEQTKRLKSLIRSLKAVYSV